jgi:GTP-binding protein
VEWSEDAARVSLQISQPRSAGNGNADKTAPHAHPTDPTVKSDPRAEVCPTPRVIMKIKSATFEISAPNLDGCPRLPLPEFAFIGRSNVGKSSLINLLAEKRDLARVSDLPGKTRLMNFFNFNNTWRLVDLPGYGYAHVSKQERADFNQAVATFLTRREPLQHTYVLIDPRLPPQAIDLDFIAWLDDAAVRFSIVFTKADKQSRSANQTAIDRFRQAALHGLDPQPDVLLTSSKTKDGRADLLQHITAQLA